MSWSIYAYFLCNYVCGFLSVSRTSVERPAVLYIEQEMFGLGPVYLKGWIKYVYLKKNLKQPPLGCLENEGWVRRIKGEEHNVIWRKQWKTPFPGWKRVKSSFQMKGVSPQKDVCQGFFFPRLRNEGCSSNHALEGWVFRLAVSHWLQFSSQCWSSVETGWRQDRDPPPNPAMDQTLLGGVFLSTNGHCFPIMFLQAVGIHPRMLPEFRKQGGGGCISTGRV